MNKPLVDISDKLKTALTLREGVGDGGGINTALDIPGGLQNILDAYNAAPAGDWGPDVNPDFGTTLQAAIGEINADRSQIAQLLQTLAAVQAQLQQAQQHGASGGGTNVILGNVGRALGAIGKVSQQPPQQPPGGASGAGTTAPTKTVVSGGAAVGIAAGSLLVGGVAGWMLRGAAKKR
jgi:hypothetical protein